MTSLVLNNRAQVPAPISPVYHIYQVIKQSFSISWTSLINAVLLLDGISTFPFKTVPKIL